MFLPVNVPLWDIFFEVTEVNLSGIVITPPMFLLGLILLFYSNKDERRNPIPVEPTPSEEE